jgi:uncharacterized repeat protein (TIGR01451 family)
MKRLLVRATALAGLLVIATFAVVQIYRGQPTVMAQESAAGQTTKKKAKSKSAATGRKTTPPAAGNTASDPGRENRYADRYPDRYADVDSADPTDARRQSGATGQVIAEFGNEAPDAGPDLFPEGNRTARANSRAAAARDPFGQQMTSDPDGGEEPLARNDDLLAADASAGYAPGSIAEPKTPRRPADETSAPQKKPAALGARKKRTPTTVPPQDRAVDHVVRERTRSAEPAKPHGKAATPHRDPFGDAAETAGQINQQVILGHGRPGNQQLEGAQSPTLVLEKAAPEEIQVGKPAIFAVRVQNVGSVMAQGVEIHDLIPQGTHLIDTRPPATGVVDGRVTWTVGAIKAGDEVTVEMELMPLAEGEIGSVATVHFAGEASARTRCTRPQLALDVSVPSEVLIGEEVMLSIRLSNPGTGAATGIVLSENIPEQLQHPAGSELEYEVGDLKPGESRQIDLAMSTVKAGQVINLLMARGDGQLQAEHQSEFTVVAPQLELSMQGPKRRYLERQATYTVTVSNPGTAAAKEVQLLTHLPKGLKFLGANNSGEYDPVTNTVHWVLEELPAKQSGQVTLTTLPVEPGEQMLKVESTAQRGLSAEQEEVVAVEGVAAILFQLADEADPIEVGGETTYEIKVLNQGSKAATNVQLVAVFPPQLKPRSAHGPTRDAITGQEVRFQPLGRLPPKGETTYQIRAQGVEPGDLRVQVQLLTDEMQSPVTKEESTRVYADE